MIEMKRNKEFMYILVIVLMTITSCGNHSEPNDIKHSSSTKMNLKMREINLPATENPLVCKTIEINEMEWTKLKEEIEAPYLMGFKANVNFLDRDEFLGVHPENFQNYQKNKYLHHFIFLIDSITISNPEHPILCVDLYDQAGKYFRVIPSEMWCIENNLSISNADFDDFYESCSEDGIYRGDE